jgi:uncharacterized protein (DUF1015 family)
MAEISPFKGVRYNQQLVPDLSKVICPPYDIISPKQQDDFYKTSEFNFIRIEFNKETPADSPADNRYTRAASAINNWIEQTILQIDLKPALYVHEHSFRVQGNPYRRRNILCLVKLEEWNTGIIRPHENIIPKAKSDRMGMLRACHANTSTVLSMYADPEGKISGILDNEEQKSPIIDVLDNTGERHQVWAISDPASIKGIQSVMGPQSLYIADGHHRYDSALTYRREMNSAKAKSTGKEGFNFVMMNLFDFKDPGLVIMPTHRLLKGVPAQILSNLQERMGQYFEITQIDMDKVDAWEKFDKSMENKTSVKIGVWGLKPNIMLVLSLKNFKAIDSFMPSGHSEHYKKLDVSLVDHVILEKLIGFVKDREDMTLDYNHDRLETVKAVQEKRYQLAFILGPVDPESIKLIADSGDRMPRKSTYFYPKAPAGLVFYKW